jgi:hypothetical protein
MSAAPTCGEERAAQAYEWAANLIGLARRLIADGVQDVDLSPIRPAIQDLCTVIKELPPVQAREWVTHLIDLQHELAALSHDMAVQRGEGGGTEPQEEGPGACR